MSYQQEPSLSRYTFPLMSVIKMQQNLCSSQREVNFHIVLHGKCTACKDPDPHQGEKLVTILNYSDPDPQHYHTYIVLSLKGKLK